MIFDSVTEKFPYVEHIPTIIFAAFLLFVVFALAVTFLPRWFLTPKVKDYVKPDDKDEDDIDSFVLAHHTERCLDSLDFYLKNGKAKLIFTVKYNIHYIDLDVICFDKEKNKKFIHLEIFAKDLDNQRRISIDLPEDCDDTAVYVNQYNEEPRCGWDLFYLPKTAPLFFSLSASAASAFIVLDLMYILHFFILIEDAKFNSYYVYSLFAIPLFAIYYFISYRKTLVYTIGDYLND